MQGTGALAAWFWLQDSTLSADGVRHAAAKLRLDVGETVEDVSRFLGHSSLAATTVYLRRLEGQEDRGWGKAAEAIGVG
jgi:integrase